jgi:hypothetical protein
MALADPLAASRGARRYGIERFLKRRFRLAPGLARFVAPADAFSE